ncbi:MAG: hypothetical protein NTZ04_01160 [Chloroflexi bacterium]|nr:hypothetical protein [Chloroflexota bacterium]
MSEGKLVLREIAAILLLAILAAVIPLFVHSSKIAAGDTGWRSPTANVADNASGNGFETAPEYAYADDAVAASNVDGAGDRHLYYDYGFSILSDANIEGIEVRLHWWLDSVDGTNSMSVDLSWDGGSSWTSAATDNVGSTTELTASLGGPTDKWGHSWIPSEFSNANFRARVTCNSDDPTRDFYLDWIPVIVYYAPVDHLAVTGGGTMTAGGSNVLTITAKDTRGNVAINYSGTKSLTFSGPSAAPDEQVPTVGGVNIGSTVSVTFTNGVSDDAAATTLLAYKDESTTVDVADNGINSSGDPAYGLTLTVKAGLADHIGVLPKMATVVAGGTQEHTATAFDAWLNSWDVTSVTSFQIVEEGDGGYWTNNVYTSEKVGTWTVRGTYGALPGDATLTVTAGSIDYYTVTSASDTQQTSVSFTVTVIAYDAYDNMATSDNTTSVTLWSDPTGMIFDGNSNGLFGETGDNVTTLASGTFNIQAKCNTVADNVTITANSGSITSSSSPYAIKEFRCFIATAAYGTPMASEIQVLRDFRDRYLVTNAPGRYFVSLYYKCSPPVARFIAHHDSLRAVVRGGLAPIIWLATIALKATMVQKLTVLCSFLITAIMTVVALIWLRRTIRSKPT